MASGFKRVNGKRVAVTQSDIERRERDRVRVEEQRAIETEKERVKQEREQALNELIDAHLSKR